MKHFPKFLLLVLLGISGACEKDDTPAVCRITNFDKATIKYDNQGRCIEVDYFSNGNAVYSFLYESNKIIVNYRQGPTPEYQYAELSLDARNYVTEIIYTPWPPGDANYRHNRILIQYTPSGYLQYVTERRTGSGNFLVKVSYTYSRDTADNYLIRDNYLEGWNSLSNEFSNQPDWIESTYNVYYYDEKLVSYPGEEHVGILENRESMSVLRYGDSFCTWSSSEFVLPTLLSPYFGKPARNLVKAVAERDWTPSLRRYNEYYYTLDERGYVKTIQMKIRNGDLSTSASIRNVDIKRSCE